MKDNISITIYQNTQDFLARARPVLESNEIVNSLLLGIALNIDRHPKRFKAAPYLALVEDEQGMVAAAVMTPPRNLLLTGERAGSKEALQLIAQDLQKDGWPVSGIFAPAPIAHAFAEVWQSLTGRPYHEGRRQRLFSLSQVIPPRPGPGRLRVATRDDLELVMRWFTAFTQEALNQKVEGAEEIRQWTESRITPGDCYLWEDGQPVSMAARSRPIVKTISIGPVYTPPELRGRGYASRCVAALSQLLLESGWQYCCLFTDLANPTSNSIYQQIGYRPICDFNEYTFPIT
jgi:predicted GNAT family acetyltransferase